MPVQTKAHRQPKAVAEKIVCPPLWKSLTAEVVGTYFLTFVSAVPIIISSLAGHLSTGEQVVPAGMLVAALIYSLGAVSGAHFNPALTLAFAERGSFPWRRLPAYWLAQVAGSFA